MRRRTSGTILALLLLLVAAGLDPVHRDAGAAGTPTCAVVAPAAGGTVAGTVALAAAATAASRVAFTLNGIPLGPARASGGGWRYTPDGGRTWGWDTAMFAGGRYEVRCVAAGPGGSVASAAVVVTVDQPVGCRVVLPDGGQPVSGTGVVLAAGHLGSVPARVEYYLHTAAAAVVPLGAATPTGYGWLLRWDSTGVGAGAYELTCTATMADGSRRGSAGRVFTVDNTTGHLWASRCLDHVPAGPADYQTLFDHRRDGWAGADGAVPVPLPDGRIVWLFGDTLAGRIDARNALLPGWRMPANSVQVQAGTCLTPVMGGDPRTPQPFLPDQDGERHWPVSGYADTSVSPPVVRMLAARVRSGECGWFRIAGVRVYTLALPDLRIVATVEAPYDETARNIPSFGTYLRRAGGTVYLYGGGGGLQCGGPAAGGPFGPGAFVARVAADRLGLDPWEYWTGTGWHRDVDRAAPMAFDGVPGPGEPWLQDVVPYGGGWLATGKLGPYSVFGPELYVWTGSAPTGPWRLFRDPGGAPVNIVPGGQGRRMYYGGMLVDSVPGAAPATPILVYSTNGLGTDQSSVATDVTVYGPRFVHPTALPPPPR